jgi:hypothetical protein
VRAQVGATHPRGESIPQGERLRDLICDKFLGGELKHKPLTAVAAIAANEAGLLAFQKYIHDLFVAFEPADFHPLICQFRWRAIATTNLDLIVERAYAAARDRLQNLVKTVKDGDSLDLRLNAETNLGRFLSGPGVVSFLFANTIESPKPARHLLSLAI